MAPAPRGRPSLTLTREPAVAGRLRIERLRWPAEPETDFPGPKEAEGREC